MTLALKKIGSAIGFDIHRSVSSSGKSLLKLNSASIFTCHNFRIAPIRRNFEADSVVFTINHGIVLA